MKHGSSHYKVEPPIWVESELGQGATFHFTANITLAAESNDDQHSLSVIRQSVLAYKSVLVFSDHEADRRLLERLLLHWHVTPAFAYSPDIMVGHLGQGKRFDAIVVKLVGQEASLTLIVQELLNYADASATIFLYVGAGQKEYFEALSPQIHAFEGPLRVDRLVDALTDAMQVSFDHEPTENNLATLGRAAYVHTESESELGQVEQTASHASNSVAAVPPSAQHIVRTGSTSRRSKFDSHMADQYPLRILIAEDNRVNQRLMTELLSRLGYQADVAGNGEEVLSVWAQQQYDLILMDIQMPIMDRLEATQHIRADTTGRRQPYIVAVTAHGREEDREQFLGAGMDQLLTKPIRVDGLVAVLVRCSREQSLRIVNR